MSADTAHLMAAGLFLLPALVWSILAYHFWEIIRARPALRNPAILSRRGVVLVASGIWSSRWTRPMGSLRCACETTVTTALTHAAKRVSTAAASSKKACRLSW